MASTSYTLNSPASDKCDICLLSKKDDVMFGELITKAFKKESTTVHYFCLLSGSNIRQTGGDKVGIYGFRILEIIDSFKNYRHEKCCFCKLESAAVRCTFPECNRTWHYPCGVENNCMTEFTGSFKSYCSEHVPNPNGDCKPEEDATCKACFEPLGTFSLANSIVASCCLEFPDRATSFLHKKCINTYCMNAGYDSMCITCPSLERKKEDWQEEMRLKGIFIPFREAVWEQDEYFKKQVKNKCEAPNCVQKTKDVYTCFVCGCFPRHLKCSKVAHHKDYYCPKCYDQSFVKRVPI